MDCDEDEYGRLRAATTVDTLTPIPGLEGVFKGGLAIDSDGNLFGGRKASNGVAVLPVSNGTFYG